MSETAILPREVDPELQRARVLVVDRNSMGQLICRMLSDHYVLDTATDALSAVRMLNRESPDVVIADIDIPGSGTRLAELMAMSPKHRSIPVILTSSRAIPRGAIRARLAGAKALLVKPFRPQQLRARVAAILRRANGGDGTLSRAEVGAQVREGITQIEDLPTFPTTYTEILKLAKSPDASAEEIAGRIQLDPGLLATVFKLANASCFGFRSRIDSIKLAVALLGLSQIADLVVSVQVFERMGNKQTDSGLDMGAFWKHAVGTAFIARGLAKWVQIEDESAYLGGLLHDVGKVVLDQHFSSYYAPALVDARRPGRWFEDAERDALGLSHTDVGGHLAVSWKLPENIQDAILYHHEPWRPCRYDRVVCVVHVADVLCNRLGYTTVEGTGAVDIDPLVAKRLSIGPKSLLRLVASAKEDVAASESFLAALRA